MPRFSANLSMLFGEVAMPERFDAAARAGFKAVEIQYPYAWPKDGISATPRASWWRAG
jgi:hydroxypyruvate isomerase